MTALRAGPPFLLGWYTSGGPPGGRSLSKDRDVRTYAKKPLDLHSRPIRNFGVRVCVVRWFGPPESACLERAGKKKIVAVPRARRCGGYRGIWIGRLPCARRCGGLRDVVQGDYLKLSLSGRGTAATNTIEKKRKEVERKAIPKWSQAGVETRLGRGVAEASTLRICETVSTRN